MSYAEKRAEGRAVLLELAAKQERYYSDQRQYTRDWGATGLDRKTACQKDGPNTDIRFTDGCLYFLTANLNSALGQGFTVEADPEFNDPECGTLMIDHTGAKFSFGTETMKECWGR